MAELKWDPLEVLMYLGVVPEVEDHAVSHTYRVCDGVLDLELILRELESVAEFTLSRTDTEDVVTRFALVIRDGVFRRNYKGVEMLIFRDCLLSPTRFYYTYLGDAFDRKSYPTGVDMALTIHPTLRLTLHE